MDAIRTENLTPKYKLGFRKGRPVALDTLNLCLRPGEVYAFPGPTGSGQGTTLTYLLAPIAPTAAQALVHDPALLLLDEPTAGVDPIGSGDIRDLIVRLKGMGKTVLLSSHLLAQVQDVCDRIGVLNLGKMILEGDVKTLISDQRR